jgi:hypothetical protein
MHGLFRTRGDLARGADETGLAQSGERRGWMETGGRLASEADARSDARIGMGLDAGFRAGEQHLGRLDSSMGAAATAQGAREGRIGDMIDNAFRQGALDAEMATRAYEALMANDMAMLESILGGNIGAAAEDYSQDERERDRTRADFDRGVDTFGAGYEVVKDINSRNEPKPRRS